ncbi:MAG: DNA-3-methyladenine glycosylase [Nitrososphaera sp.]|uniref:Putative 3-methyladenine DNA glycosylase n=1 Tax=Nitrososphaera gargensis (strain Ga9.2) TaxID=1237085 RepID=K0IMX1_NITGG|nr:DNA-3-methyladenine glycosylase [Candidatus Nitrososphaera gargensis]AFU58364.1 putative 3-methyladenine DNA glycosylase [Candidatus Nitrososphaera gargensis Ga9.2]
MSCPPISFYRRPTEVVARDLVGKKLVRTIRENGRIFRLAGTIVETEAYGYSDDPASHACMGPTARNRVMFGDVGRAYVYFTYGNHFCVNVSARSSTIEAGAVLIRGLEPVEGIEIMKKLRPVDDAFSLTSGPGKLTQALNISSALNGVDMTNPESELHIEFGISKSIRIMATPRIGITRAVDRKWRFVDPASPYVSRRIQIKAI